MKNAKELIEKYRLGICSPEEKQILEKWFHHLGEDELSEFTDEELVLARNRAMNPPKEAHQLGTPWLKYLSAAAILIFVSFASYFYLIRDAEQSDTQFSQVNDIKPGSNDAILTLSDGQKISLNDTQNGEISEQYGIKVVKAADGQLIYSLSDPEDLSHANSFNTIETPMGGQYQVNLPDGSKVWLNSASSLRYPIKFIGPNRNVEITGEAYFEVAKNTGMPFRVKVGEQVIEVLGTHFNVMAYPDEQSINTTLVEGSVKVSSGRNSTVILPGQQSRVSQSEIKVLDVDVNDFTAWKNGFFVFKNENIESMMRKISRWYNVEIIYKGDITHKSFGGIISRSRNISEVLKILELTGSLHFEIESNPSNPTERRVTVMP